MTPDSPSSPGRRTIRFDDLSGEGPVEVTHAELEDVPTQELAMPRLLEPGDDASPAEPAAEAEPVTDAETAAVAAPAAELPVVEAATPPAPAPTPEARVDDAPVPAAPSSAAPPSGAPVSVTSGDEPASEASVGAAEPVSTRAAEPPDAELASEPVAAASTTHSADEPASAPRTITFDDLAARPPATDDPSADDDALEGMFSETDDEDAGPRPAARIPLPPRPRRRPATAPAAAATSVAVEPGDRDRPHPVSPGRALAGAALAVSGVALGVVALLWVTDDPSVDPAADGLSTAQSSQGRSSQDRTDEVVSAPSPAAPSPAAVPSPTAVPSPASSAAPVVPVTVLNNSRRDGLAALAAAQFEDGGWPVAQTGNFRGRIPVTTVYYDPGLEASARAFADRFGGIARVRPSFEGLPAQGVVVVVTREFAA